MPTRRQTWALVEALWGVTVGLGFQGPVAVAGKDPEGLLANLGPLEMTKV